ncbi:MAG TPA: type II toxin-antitoxin system HipA family toxin [Kofleriaceae bacterium]|jgi:serine/threonine-protein kinase HipA
MERELDVVLELDGTDVLVGRLWSRTRGARESASFEYDGTWLTRRGAFALDPELPLATGRAHTERPLFNAFTDPAPDRWGQTLMRRQERARAKAEGRTPRTLLASDFLTLVDDATRLGALRFRDAGSRAFLTVGGGVPPLVQLPRLLRASAAVVADEESDDDLALLLAPGTSLGGARPKASVRRSDGTLAIAKFPSKEDDWPVTRWEAATLAMAQAAGIVVPRFELVTILKKPVLIIDRFDRADDRRIPYMSAMTALTARDGDQRSYLELADVLRAGGHDTREQLAQLWRRIVFSVLVSNTDDHLRNHGFLRAADGWALAPAFDLNPMPSDVRPRVHALALDETDPTASLKTVRAIAGSFGVSAARATSIIREVGGVTKKWRTFAQKHGLSPREIERMESAFDHDDANAAR